MRRWLLLAVVNWLRKPANRDKAKNAWRGFRGKNTGKRGPGNNPNRPPGNRPD